MKEKRLNIISILLLVMTASCVHNAKQAPIDEIEISEPSQEEYGIKKKDDNHGTIYVDASDYKQWQYIDLQSGQIISVKVGESVPENWDFAVHRFDVKTNGGSAFETEITDMSQTDKASDISQEKFISDIETSDKVIVDMSGMMQGKIKYATDNYNPCLSRWLDVNMKNMPPEFNLSDKVYQLRLSSGKIVYLHFTDYMNKSNELGYITIDYKIHAI